MDLRSTHTYSQPHWFVCGLKWFFVFAMMIPFDLHAMIVIINYILFVYYSHWLLYIGHFWLLCIGCFGYYRLLLVAMGYYWSLLLIIWVLTIQLILTFIDSQHQPQRLPIHLHSFFSVYIHNVIPVIPLFGWFFNHQPVDMFSRILEHWDLSSGNST
jgi:hypothetical protein